MSAGNSPHRANFLAGLQVLELGDGVAGGATTSLLWALGADVSAVVDSSSPHRRGRPRVSDGSGQASLVSIILDRGKQLMTATNRAELEAVVDREAFDVVIVDRVLAPAGPLASLADVDSYVAFVEQHNRRAWLTISAFGLTGPRAGESGTELTVAAASGMLATVREPRTGQPLKLAGQQSLLNTGQAGALAACHAIDLASTGAPVHLDLAAVEAALAMGPLLEVGGLLLNTGGGGGARRYGAPASFYGCTDGLIRISAMEDHQWQGVVTAMGSPEWTARFSTTEARVDSAEEVDAYVAAWTRRLTKQEAETLLQARGVPATAVYSPAEILDSPQLAHRGTLEPLSLDEGREALVVGEPFRFFESSGSRQRRTLRGLRVLEASRVLAVPLAGAMLGTLGAEVTKLEDLPRLDMYRRRGPYIDGTPGTERSAYFTLMNHSKVSSAFDVDADRERLDALLDATDVVVENLGRKRGLALGLSALATPNHRRDMLVVSSSGFGLDGPRADYRAYAYNLQASCAMGYLTRGEDGESAEIDIAWADLVSAYALATIVAAWAVGPSGNPGAGVDFAMADLVIAHFNEFIASASLDGASDQSVDQANELSPYAPHGVYPAADGWVAVSVDGDEQFGLLVKALVNEALAGDNFSSADARFEQSRRLDALIARSSLVRPAEDLAAELRALGVAAERVASPEDLLESPQLASRRFFVPVQHDDWGSRRIVGIPWRPYGGPPLPLRPPPRLRPVEDRT